MNPTDLQALIEEATFDFTMGDDAAAVAKLTRATDLEPDSFAAWHALAEIHFSARRFEQALAAAGKAHAIQPDDIFVNTSLSRIWMECGNKDMAEKFGAAARMLGWKDSLQQDASLKKPGT